MSFNGLGKIMNTVFMLLAQFEEAIIPLGKVCDDYFGCSLRTAMNKAKAEDLPIPTFKIGSSAKAPYYIHLNDLAEYIDAQRAKAKEEWFRVNT